MKQPSTSCHGRAFRYFPILTILFLVVCTAIRVQAQQSTLPCNSTVSTPFENSAFSGLVKTDDQTGLSGWTQPDRVVDGDLMNFARGTIVVGGSLTLAVADPGSHTYSAGNFAGFALRSTLIQLSAFGAITIKTYLDASSTPQETSTSANLIALSTNLLTGSDAYEVGFYTTKPFNKIEITISSSLGAGIYDVYYAVMRGYCATNTPLACNTPTRLNAPAFPVIVNPLNTGFGGVVNVGSITNPDNAISVSPDDAASLAVTGSVLGSGSFAIKLQNQVFDATTNALVDGYPAGTFAGLDISNPNLIGIDANSGIRLQTYYKGVATGDIAAVGSLFVSGNTSLLTGTGRRTIGLVTTAPFDEIKLTVARGLLSVDLGTVLIYGAVVKRLCAATLACNTTYPLNNTTFPTIVDPARTGLTGTLGVALTIQNQDNVISSNTADFATITNTASTATTASIGVLDPVDTYPAGTFAGFTVRKVTGLTAATLFSRLTITTYLDGSLVESRSAGNLLDLSIALFGLSTDYFNVGFVTKQPFDEIQLSVAPFVDLGVLSGHLDVYGAFIDTRTSVGNGLVCTLSTNPDFAVTNKNVPVSGSVKTNDVVPVGTTYGTSPTLVSQPGGSSPSLTMTSTGSYTFTSGTPGVYVYSVPVCLSAVCISQTLTVTVLDPTINTNKPVANPDVASTTGASTNPPSVTVNVKANDGPGNPGGILGPPTITTSPTNGSAAVDGSGNVVYTPNAGFYGTDVLTYQVCETPGTNLCATSTVTITVNAPGSTNSTLAADDYISTYQGAAVSGNVKTNDTDPEGNTQTVTMQNTAIPGKGTLALAADGTYTFTPVAGATGPVDFSYTTTDNGTPTASANGTLHILINPFNPNPDFAVTNKNVPVTGSVQTNDVIPVGTTYGTTPTLTSSPSGSAPTLTITSTGSYTFTSGTPGVYTYSVPVCVPTTSPTCTTQTLTITVLDPASTTNNPVANPDFATTTGDPSSPAPVTVNVRANDGPGNTGGTLQTPTIPNQPAHGTASITGGNLVYTPAAGFYGIDVVTYQVCETPSTPSCATATVTITVKAPGAPANVSVNDDYVSTPGTPVSSNVLTNDLGNGLSVSNPGTTVTSSGTLVLTSSGSYTFTPAPGVTGPVDFTYTACDNSTPSVCGSATLHILVDQGIPDLTPTILMDNLNFAPSSVGTTRDFIINILEVAKVATTGTVAFKILKPTAFTITYSTTSGTSDVFGGLPNTNSQWTFSEDQNYITVQTTAGFAASSNKIIGFHIARMASIAPNTGQSITVTIVPNTGGEQNFPNNIAVTGIVAN